MLGSFTHHSINQSPSGRQGDGDERRAGTEAGVAIVARRTLLLLDVDLAANKVRI